MITAFILIKNKPGKEYLILRKLENIIEIRLTEEQISNLSKGEHIHIDIENKHLIINKI